MTTDLTHGSLFTGCGGLDLAVEGVFGARTVWQAENHPAPSRVLAARWPGVPNLGDVAWSNLPAVERVDVMSGGFPCQDVSHAGPHDGLAPGTRTGLWSAMARAINELRPAYVVAENVRGLLSARSSSEVEPCPWCMGDIGAGSALRALGAVLGDLADIGYDASWYGLRASDVGAPHTRYRVFIVAADPNNIGLLGRMEARQRRPEPADGHRRAVQHAGRPTRVVAWGKYAAAIERWEDVTGVSAPSPIEPNRDGTGHRLTASFIEWLMGLPPGWVTDVPGVSRYQRVRMLGAAVVPQQADAALRVLLPTMGVAA